MLPHCVSVLCCNACSWILRCHSSRPNQIDGNYMFSINCYLYNPIFVRKQWIKYAVLCCSSVIYVNVCTASMVELSFLKPYLLFRLFGKQVYRSGWAALLYFNYCIRADHVKCRCYLSMSPVLWRSFLCLTFTSRLCM